MPSHGTRSSNHGTERGLLACPGPGPSKKEGRHRLSSVQNGDGCRGPVHVLGEGALHLLAARFPGLGAASFLPDVKLDHVSRASFPSQEYLLRTPTSEAPGWRSVRARCRRGGGLRQGRAGDGRWGLSSGAETPGTCSPRSRYGRRAGRPTFQPQVEAGPSVCVLRECSSASPPTQWEGVQKSFKAQSCSSPR